MAEGFRLRFGTILGILLVVGLAIGALVALESGRDGHKSSTVPAVQPVGVSRSVPAGQLESDRLMTQQMGNVGSGMQAVMGGQGMLERSTDSVYLRQLENQAHEVDRMLARHP